MSQENSLTSVTVPQAKIDALCVRALFARSRKGAMLAPFAMLFLCWIEKDVVSMSLILGWLILNIFPDLANFLLTSRLLKHPPLDERTPYWHNWQIFMRSFQGLCWGVAAIFFHIEGAGSFINDLSVLVVLVTVSAVSIVNISPSLRSLAGFSFGILLIPAGYYFWLGDTQHVLFGIGLILLWAVELETGRDAYKQFVEGLRWGVINQETSSQLEIRNNQLDELNQQLSAMAIHDKLTDLYNRHFIVDELKQQHDLFVRYGTVCSIVMLDIDYFKQVNDLHGHAVGDNVLVAFSRFIERQLRQGDFFARYGGEEFMLVLPITGLEDAMQFANRIRSTLAGAPLIDRPVSLTITASFGVAQIGLGDAVEDWLKRADQALYRAKESGRNCVME